MRLTKIQKALKEMNIEYRYEENNRCGEIRFEKNNKIFMIEEYVGNNGKTPIGIYTNINKIGQYGSQDYIANLIKNGNIE
ncbi:MAG: hypothetical protein PHT02_01095 [Tissierellia bacterium]|nr:hypothetical protein [Tissierellia bacterium]